MAVLNRLDLRGADGPLGSLLPRPVVAGEGPVATVRDILADVRARGDAALAELTARYDGSVPEVWRVPDTEVAAALDSVPAEVRDALVCAAANIEAYHRTQCHDEIRHDSPGMVVRSRTVPVDRAGCYVPGGRAAYPSTVLMTAVPARVAGVPEVVLCVPPGPDGHITPVVLAAAAVAGVDEVYAVGGAQAIAALAFGTESIPAVDVIVGPGNVYVAVAKREVAGIVGVPSAFAGPSEVVVVADHTTPVELAAVDLCVQAEHGPDGLAWLITWDGAVADAVDAAVEAVVAGAPRAEHITATLAEGGYGVVVDGPEAALEVANAIAPEHLQLMTADPEALLGGVRHAGAVFCGPWAPASLGDYAAGPSHVLPTNGSARFSGALTVADFCKDVHVVSVDPAGFERLAPTVVTLAEAEGLDAHAQSVRLRTALLAGAALAPPPRGRPTVRPDLVALEGYHSPQVEVDVRLNTNESPMAPPAAWRDALAAELSLIDWHRYPDRSAGELRSAIAGLHGVDPSMVLAANGSNEILQLVLLAFGGPGRSAAVFEPTYAMHSQIARITGTAVAEGERGPGFELDFAEVQRVVETTSPTVVFLCSPNNPTGMVEDRTVVERTLELVTALDSLLVVDEAYAEFAPWSAIELVDEDVPLVVTRTFSKTWSMAAARLGCLVGPRWLVSELDKVVLPYHLDVAKQVAGRLALGYVDEMDERVRTLVSERERIVAALDALPVTQWPSGANFVLFRPDTVGGQQVWEALLERSVLVRNCASWPRLDDCLRVTVGTADENSAFLAALGEILG